MLSTWHNRDTKEVCRKTAKEVEVFQKPAVVIDYTSKMGGGWTEQTTTVPAMGS
jgi:hypothetical protein